MRLSNAPFRRVAGDMNPRFKKGLFAGSTLTVAATLFVTIDISRHSSPLRTGATADEAWNFIHTSAATHTRASSLPIPLFRYTAWSADTHCITCESRFYWRTNTFLATRTITYALGTNGLISGTRSQWKWSSSKAAPPPRFPVPGIRIQQGATNMYMYRVTY
jgi:hypothetical protein